MPSFHRQKMLRQSVFWRIGEDIPKSLSLVLMTLSIAVPLCLWWIISSLEVVDPLFLPTPIAVGKAFLRLW